MLILFTIFILSALCHAKEPVFAVVEYHPFINNLSENVEKYTQIITESNNNLDLIVFPEDTLHFGSSTDKLNDYSTFITKGDNPCLLENQYPDFIKKLSCAAKEKNTFVVINTVEKEKCPNDSQDRNCVIFGNHYYNTDLVFNKEGTIETRYRKYNLFGEYPLDKPDMEDITFSIDNAKFGIFTCFDILFQTPAEKLVREDKINYAIFPTMWFSELPFLTALQTQQMWSMTHNITLLAAGANNVLFGSGGSGIFKGIAMDPINPFIQPESAEGTSTIIEINGETPKSTNNLDNFRLKPDPIIGDMKAILLPLSESSTTTISHNDISCTINVTLQKSNVTNKNSISYTYYAVAYSGVRTFSGVYNGGVDICGIIACTEKDNIQSCGKRHLDSNSPVWPLQFKTIEIDAEIQGIDNRSQYPNTVLQSLQPILPSKLKWTKNELGGTTKILFRLDEEVKEILTFAVYGRNFGLDSPN